MQEALCALVSFALYTIAALRERKTVPLKPTDWSAARGRNYWPHAALQSVGSRGTVFLSRRAAIVFHAKDTKAVNAYCMNFLLSNVLQRLVLGRVGRNLTDARFV